MDIPEKIQIAARDFLGHFGVERRGANKVEAIKEILDSLDLATEPDFEFAWIDEPIWLRLKEGVVPNIDCAKEKESETGSSEDGANEVVLEGNLTAVAHAEEQAKDSLTSEEPDILSRVETTDRILADDPTYRIGSLPAANKKLVVVSNDGPLTTAITLMLQHDFSQLPVMQGDREVKGMITWKSIGSRLSAGRMCNMVGDCREDARIVDSNRTLFEAISTIVEFGYVLVRDQRDKRITGIVTASDLSLQFQELSEPFLLLRKIELHIRQILQPKLSNTDFRLLGEAPYQISTPQKVEELTICQYIRLFQHPDVWKKLGLNNIDSKTFISLLDQVRTIRNEVMHFDRDPMTLEQLETLKKTTRFLQSLFEILPKDRI